VVNFLIAGHIFHYSCLTIAKLTEALLKLSDAKERLHLLGKSMKVSRNHERFPVSFPKSAITQIKVITTTLIPGKHFEMLRQ